LDIADRLEVVVRRHVLEAMPADPSGELETMGLSNLLIVFGNWRNRFVAPCPRRVHVSREFSSELPLSPYKDAVAELRRKIEAGEDVYPHLSKGIEVAYTPQVEREAARSRTRDLDAMLAAHGLHHLHLGMEKRGRFAVRSAELLFAAFRSADAYFVGLFPHGAWARRDVLERIVRNWPDAELLHRSETAIGLTQDFSDEDRLELMMAGVSTAIEIDGKVYAALGQTVAGTPVEVTMRVNAFMWELTYLREEGLTVRLQKRGADPSRYWTPAVRDECAGLLSSQGFLALGRLS
jgi:hypothetical protein